MTSPHEPPTVSPTIRFGLIFAVVVLLAIGGGTAVARSGKRTTDGQTQAAAVSTTIAPDTTGASSTAAPRAATATTATPSAAATVTTGPTSGLSAGGAGQVPGSDQNPNTGGTWLVIPALILLAGGVAGRRLAARA